MTKHDNSMSPDASPSQIIKKVGTRRVNDIPLYIIIAIIAGFVLIIAYFIASKSYPEKSSKESVQSQPTSTTKMHAQAVIGEYKHGLIPAVSEEKDLIQPSINQPSNHSSKLTPTKDDQSNLQQLPSNEDLERIRTIKMQQLDAAVKAKTKVQIDLPKTTNQKADSSYAALTAIGRSDDPTAAYQAQLAKLQGNALSGLSGSGGVGVSENALSKPNNKIDAMQQFANNTKDRWRLDSKIEAPRTPYELRAGFVLPATLVSGIKSELPGQIIAQVAQSIYDTPTGKYLLIPQGSKLVGTYSSDVAYGQSRVLVAWQRITFPDGKVLDIGEMPGADSAGYSGFHDQVNNHYVRIFGSAIMMSAITAGFAYSQDVNEEDDDWFVAPTASSELSAALGQQLGYVASQMIAKNLNIAPTLEIRPGYRFNVMLIKDLTFENSYQSFDY